MFIVDQKTNIVHDLSRPQYECHIGSIPKDQRKKIHTVDGVKRFLNDPMIKGANGCKFCMPEYHEFDMSSIFR